jgi:chemotaxis protein methyltransferase CheR
MLTPESYRRVRFEGRPAAPPTPVPNLLPPSSSASQLSHAKQRPRRPEPTLADDERRLISAVLAAAGLDAAHYRSGPFRRRLPAVLRALRVADAAEAAKRVAGNPAQTDRALETLLIGHTQLFRDPDTFFDLRSTVLPELLAGREGLRVWSVGCSAGAELLSAALLLAERSALASSQLRGSDCRPEAIRAARAKTAADVLLALPARFDHLRPQAETIGFGAAIAQADWVLEDALTAKPTPDAWDLVFCRNVAIYMDPESSQRLWSRLVAALAPGGVLVTGRAERPPATLPLVRLAKCIYRLEGAGICLT